MNKNGKKISSDDVIIGLLSAGVIVWVGSLVIHTLYVSGVNHTNLIPLIFGGIMLGMAGLILKLMIIDGFTSSPRSSASYHQEDSGLWIRHNSIHLSADTLDSGVSATSMDSGAYSQGLTQTSLLAPAAYTNFEVGSTFDSGPAFNSWSSFDHESSSTDSTSHSSMFGD